MKLRTFRALLAVAVVVCTWALPSEHGYVAIVCWAAVCGAAFGVAATLVGSSLPFVASVMFVGTAILPVVALFVIAQPVYGNWGALATEFATAGRTLLPMFGLEFLLPTMAGMAASLATASMRGRRSPMQGSAE